MNNEKEQKEAEQAYQDTFGISWKDYVTEAYSTRSNAQDKIFKQIDKEYKYKASLKERLAQLYDQQRQRTPEQRLER